MSSSAAVTEAEFDNELRGPNNGKAIENDDRPSLDTVNDNIHIPRLDAAEDNGHSLDEVHPFSKLSSVRKTILVVIFCVASFVDTCQGSGVGLAVAEISKDINLPLNQIVWIITAYSLTFASFLLFAGRLSDIIPAELVFMTGFLGLGIVSLVISFLTTNKYAFLVVRAISGIFGALTIPSAYHLLVHMYPDPLMKQKKLSLIGLAGALGSVLGVVLSGLTMLASYHWFFRLLAVLCLIFSSVLPLVLPMTRTNLFRSTTPSPLPTWKRLDLPGVTLMLLFLATFNLALTQGPIDGWSDASFIAPIVLSILLAPSFFIWEAYIPPNIAVLPTSIWKIKNEIIGSIVLLVPLSFFYSSQLLFATYFQHIRSWSPLHSAAALLPQGIAAVIAGGMTQFTPIIIQNPRVAVALSGVLCIASQMLMYFSDGGWGDDYWRFVFPGFILGGIGAIVMFMSVGVNLVSNTPPEMSGVAGAWNQVVAQTGATIALAVQAGLEGSDLRDWRKNARTFWYEASAFAAVAVVYGVWYQKPGAAHEEHEAARERIRVALEKREERRGLGEK